jgi:putative ABC transport system permease protein
MTPALLALWRDWRSGELRLLALAVVLAVAALTSVSFFAQRMSLALTLNARELLGGDLVIASDQPAPDELRLLGERAGATWARSATFPSMARAPQDRGGAARLVAVKAVSEAYPLRAKLKLRTDRSEAPQERSAGPARGQVWVDPALLAGLNLRAGDALELGDLALKIEGELILESDRGSGFTNFAPRVMIHEADLPATGLIQPASRVRYRLAMALPKDDPQGARQLAAKLEDAVALRGFRGVQIESLASGRPEMRQTLDRAEQFLGLVALITALLAAVAIGMATRDYAQRRLDACAMLRVLGMAQGRMARQFALQFLVLAVLAGAVGVGLGWALHWVFVGLLASLLGTSLPAATWAPALWGWAVAALLVWAFGLPPVLQLAKVPPLRVIRRDLGALQAASASAWLLGGLGFGLLLWGVSGSARLASWAAAGFALTLVLLAAVGALAVWGLRWAMPRWRSAPWLQMAGRQLSARPRFAVLQIGALGLGMMALILLVLLRTDLVASWRQATPPDAPNRFVINVLPDQAQAFQGQLREAGVDRYDWYPMIRGRLVAVNGRAVTVGEQSSDRARRLVDREFNISHAQALPARNEVVAGRWVADEADGVSVEQGLAQTLGLKLGDTLRFDVGGQALEARITSLRKVDWASMRVNFFVIFPRTSLPPEVPSTYIAAFRSPTSEPGANGEEPPRVGLARSAAERLDDAISRQFPNVTTVDVSASIAQVQGVLNQVIQAVEFLFGFTVLAGLVVLLSAVATTREARIHEYAVLRALGASSRLLRSAQWAELAGLGALAGAVAALCAAGLAWALARFVFEFAWSPAWALWPVCMAAGALMAWVAGAWGLRDVLRRPVAQTLRAATRE